MDPQERDDGYVLGMMLRLQLDPSKCPLAVVGRELLKSHTRLDDARLTHAVDRLVARQLLSPSLTGLQLTANARALVEALPGARARGLVR
jgi:RIO-like serine/threonine protein kinase